MHPRLLFLTITLEGYVVLAAELLAIRQLTPYVGNATDSIAVIIAAVLLPLAIGYHVGGRTLYKPSQVNALRLQLARNLLIAGAILALGFINLHAGIFFETLSALGIQHRLARTVLYVSCFLVYPTYLLGQTIPIASQALPPGNLARLTGRMLFYSTLGSFMGSIISTIILMAWLGVHNTFTITLTMLMMLVILLTNNARHAYTVFAVLLVLYTAVLNGDPVMDKLHIVQNNAYNQVAVINKNGERYFSVNNSFSSRTGARGSYPYVNFMEDIITRFSPANKPLNILVIGAGGFTLGLKDTKNNYTFLDIDPDLKHTAETYFLGHTLAPNKHFVAESARPWLRAQTGSYDVIVADAFTNVFTTPTDLITQEFFTELKGHLNPGGIFMMNAIISPKFATPYSRVLDTTLRTAFPYINRQLILSEISAHNPEYVNAIYVYFHPLTPAPPANPHPYTDLLNRYFLHH
jgi:predicted membrane-bound spermidine synthase